MKAIYKGCACGESRPHIKCNDERVNQAIAVFLKKRNGKRTAIMPTINGGIYQYKLDYDGMFAWGATNKISKIHLDIWQDMTRNNEIIWLKTPVSHYHVWHICNCKKCNGKIFTHSQGDWDSHLKYSDDVYTFPSYN